MTPRVSVVIPTRRRPEGLACAMASVAAQTDVDFAGVELVVVENDDAPASRDQVAAFATFAPFPTVYVHEPRPGVAHARNSAVVKARGEFIAFLDDDEEASDGWLKALLDGQSKFAADAVFGPVRGRAPEAPEEHRAYLEYFFSRRGPETAQVIETPYGCGCSLVRVAALPHPTAPFALTQNHIGGEDDLLFMAMKAAGSRFAWTPDAWVHEDPVPERQTLAYAYRRAFAYGQGPAHAEWRRSPPNLPMVAFWMAVGVGQSLVYGADAGFKWLIGAPDRAFALHRAAGGLGKVLWFPPFKPKFYGLPAG